MKQLIHGASLKVQSEYEKIEHEFGKFIKIAVFFENANFLATDYIPLTSSVHMILEDENKNQLHIESCNCGYSGSGPHATTRLLSSIGIDESIAESLVFHNDGLQFEINDRGNIISETLNTAIYFHPSGRDTDKCKSILLDSNIYIELLQRKLIFFNPQYHSFIGLLNFLSQKNFVSFEYYIGKNSPLENYLRADFFKNVSIYNGIPDLQGAEQVNLVIKEKNLEISFFIDRQCELQTIDAIFMALKHKTLFPEERYSICIKPANAFQTLIGYTFKKKVSQHEVIYLNQGR